MLENLQEKFASRRKGKLKYGKYQIIGYSELESDAPNSGMPASFRSSGILACRS